MSADGDSCGSEHCITCGDDGVPMTVVLVDEARGLALCEDALARLEPAA